MLLPVFFAAIFGLLFVVVWVWSRVKKQAMPASLKNRVINGYLSLLSLGFLTLATTALEPFGCRIEKDNRWTLVADPSRLCFEGWWKELVPFAVIGIVVYVLGIPLTVLWWLLRNRSNLTNPDFVERYGGLYSSYSPSLPHWEPIVMAEKVAIAAIGLLLSGFVMLQVMLLQVVFVVTLSLYQTYSPFVRGKDNRLHAVLRWTSLLVLVAAALFRADQFPSQSIRRAVEVTALILIALGIAILLASVLYNMWQIRETLKVKIPKELEKLIGLLAGPYGRVSIARWLSAVKGAWTDRLSTLLVSIKAERDAEPDPSSDLVVAVFTGGVFADQAVPAVRAWVTTRLDDPDGAEELALFKECFFSVGKVNGKSAVKGIRPLSAPCAPATRLFAASPRTAPKTC
jgi:hypothetical protein